MSDQKPSDSLEELRDAIDRVDAELIRLFAQRMELARRVGAYKKERNLPVLDPERERRLIASRVAQAGDPGLAGPVAELFETLMRLSREAQAAVVAMVAPRHIYLVGMPGSGKSTLGQALAASLSLPFADMDARIETLAAMPIARIFAESGEQAFRRLESEALAQCAHGPPQVVATGGGAVLCEANVALMRATGTVLWVDRPLDQILGDLRQDTRPLLAGDAAERLRALYAEREALYRAAAHYRLDNSGALAHTVQRALALLKGEPHEKQIGTDVP